MEEISTLKDLYYHQPQLCDLFKDTIESGTNDSIRSCKGYIYLTEDFSKNINTPGYWAKEEQQISTNTLDYVIEICSVLGQYATCVGHDIGIAYSFSSAELNMNGKKKNKITVPQEIIRPGVESNMKVADNNIKR